jgi:phage gp29-like protein
MPSIKAIQQFFRDLIPTKTVTRFDTRAMHVALAHTLTVDRVQAIFRSAEQGQVEELFALYRDILLAHSHLQGRFADRKRAVLGDTWTVQPFDKKRPEDAEAADALWPLIHHPDWITACNHLLDASLWPVAVVEKVFRPSSVAGLTYEIARLVPVPHDLLDFSAGRLRIRDTDEAGRPLSTCHDADSHRYIVHHGHLLTMPDNWGGPMRSLVFWWLLGTMGREWWARFLDRYGSPYTVAKYDSGDEDSRSVLMSALALATKLGGLVVTRETEIEIKQAATTDAGAAFEKFHDICNREISKLILGQTLSSDAQATGLGSGVATTQEGVRQDIRQFDARLLGATISTQLATQFLRINGRKGAPPLFVCGTVSPAELKAIGDFLTSLKTGGMRVADEGIEILSERAGLPLERDASAAANPFAPFSVRAFSAALASTGRPEDAIAREAAATLSQALGRHFAPVREIILRSTSPDDAIAGVQAYCARLDTRAAAKVIEEVLIAYAANGSMSVGR